MSRLFARVVLALALVGAAAGCEHQSAYAVSTVHDEVVKGRLNAQWFTRDVYGKEGLAAVELVYCPIVAGAPTVCRTAIVWQDARSVLMEK
jgi:hypothetical protein